jgi:hypothetical protein
VIQAQSADGVIHQFPEGTPQAVVDRAMREYIAMHPVHPSAAEDTARGGLTGLVEGMSRQGGVFGDIPALAHEAAQRVVDFGFRHAGVDTKGLHIPAAAFAGGNPLTNRALSTIADLAGRIPGVDPRTMRLALALTSPGQPMAVAPTSTEVQGAVTRDQPLYQPKTTAGKYARTIAQYAPAAGLPTNSKNVALALLQRGANMVVPGSAAETAGQLTEGTPYEPWARTTAGIVGGGLTALATAPRPATQILSQATRGVSDEQIGQAQRLMADAQGRGIKLTLAEALQQVTDNGTGLGRLQRVIEGTKIGEEKFAPVMAERPAQVRQAVMDYADTLAPATDNPSMIAVDARNAAENGLTGVRRFINAGVSDRYDALAGQQLDPEKYAELAKNPSYSAALAEVRGHPELGATVAHLPDNNLAVVNEVTKRLNTLADSVRPTPVVRGDNGLAALRDQAAAMANRVAGEASPDWRAAREGVAAGSRAYLEPLRAGPVGSVAAPDATVQTQTAALFPSKPIEGAPAETDAAMRLLSSQNPNVPPSLSRQHLVNALNEATQNLQGGPNQWGGARYAATIAGNPEQRATLLAGVGASGGDTSSLDQLLNALAATGARQRQGSSTAFNIEDLKNLGAAGVAGDAVKSVADLPGIPRRLGDAYTRFQMGQNTSRLADALLADPEVATTILRNARTASPPDLKGVTALEYLLLAQKKREDASVP